MFNATPIAHSIHLLYPNQIGVKCPLIELGGGGLKDIDEL